MQVNEMFYTPKSMEDLANWLRDTGEPTASMAAMLMWNLIASGNYKEKEDADKSTTNDTSAL